MGRRWRALTAGLPLFAAPSEPSGGGSKKDEKKLKKDEKKAQKGKGGGDRGR